jgi:hypothetical protein
VSAYTIGGTTNSAIRSPNTHHMYVSCGAVSSGVGARGSAGISETQVAAQSTVKKAITEAPSAVRTGACEGRSSRLW